MSLFSRRTGTESEKTKDAEKELEEAANADSSIWPPASVRQQAKALLDSLTALTKQGRDAAKDDNRPSTPQNDSNPEAVQAALRNGSLGFGFSAGGMLFPYYIGAASNQFCTLAEMCSQPLCQGVCKVLVILFAVTGISDLTCSGCCLPSFDAVLPESISNARFCMPAPQEQSERERCA